MERVLIVDDEPEIRDLLVLMLSDEGYDVLCAADGPEALEAYQKTECSVVVTDMYMSGMDGLELIRQLRKLDEEAAIIVLTAFGDLENAVSVLRSDGVCDYLAKPLESPDVLISAVRGALEKRRLRLENKRLVAQLEKAKTGLENQVAARTGALIQSNQLLSAELLRRKQSEAALKEAQIDLERRVVQRTAKLADLNQQLNHKIAEHRRTEDALRRSEMKAKMQFLELELLYSSAPVGLCLLDKALKFIKTNAAMAGVTGRPFEEHKGQKVGDISPRLAKQILPACHILMTTGKPLRSYVIALPKKGGRHPHAGHWLVSSYPLIMEDGAITATGHIFQNISELRQAQEHIRKSKTMLQAVFDGISDPLIMIDRNLAVRMFNSAAKQYFGIREYRDLIGKKCGDLPCDGNPCGSCQIPEAVKKGQAAVFERRGFRDNNRTEQVTIYPLSQSAGGLEGSIVKIADITETKALEHQMIRNEKLIALGFLVSGIAHEINNPNGFVTFNLPILRSYLQAMVSQATQSAGAYQSRDWFGMSFEDFCKEVFSLIDNMEHGAQRISEIVVSLRSLVQTDTAPLKRRPCDLNIILKHAASLCRSELEKKVKHFDVQYPPGLPQVILDPGPLEQILINLLINAAHAVDKPDGRIDLSVAVSEGDLLKIEVRDNGCGMDATILPIIFDPFFTTKAPGVGTGLGLSVCHSLVNAMNGAIHVESAPGLGSTFSVRVPALFCRAEEKTANGPDGTPLKKGAPPPDAFLKRTDHAGPGKKHLETMAFVSERESQQ